MKKTFLTLLLAVFIAGAVSAQGYSGPTLRKKYNNFSFVSQKAFLIQGFEESQLSKSNFGFGYTNGRSYILHGRPIAGLLSIGIDATWFDIQYVNSDNYNGAWTIHQADIAMGVGPSVHVTPFRQLGIHAYVRYNPTFAMMYMTNGDDSSFAGGYQSVLVSGGAISWGLISLGLEGRWGKGNYKDFKKPEDGEKTKIKVKNSGLRVYVSLRF